MTVKRTLAMLALVWWLFYWDGEHWMPFGNWDSRSLYEKNAESFRAQGLHAVCIQVKSW